MENHDLDELDDLLDDADLLEYQVLLEGYDEDDSPVDYCEIIKISKTENEAIDFAANYNETPEISLEISEKRVKYLRINVYTTVKFDEFEKLEDLIYSRVILLN